MAVNVGDLVATLRLDVANFLKGIESSDRSMSEFSRASSEAAHAATEGLQRSLERVGVQGVNLGRVLTSLTSPLGLLTAGVLTFAATTGAALEKFRQMGEEARRLSALSGLSASRADDLGDVAQLKGIESGKLEAAMYRLAGDLDEGGRKLEQFGISARTAAGNLKEPGEVFLEVREKIAALGSSAAQNAAMMDLFGRSGRELLPLFRLTAAEFEHLQQVANEKGVWSEEDQANAVRMTERLNELKLSVEGLMSELARSVGLPAIAAASGVADYISGWLRQRELIARNSRDATVSDNQGNAYSTGPLSWIGKAASFASGFVPSLMSSIPGWRSLFGDVEESNARLLRRPEDVEADVAARAGLAAEAEKRAAVGTPEGQLTAARAALERARAGVAGGQLVQQVGLTTRETQTLGLVNQGELEATKRTLAQRGELITRSTATFTATEEAGIVARMALAKQERAAVEAYHARRIELVRLTKDTDLNAVRDAEHARDAALGQLTQNELALETQRQRAVLEEQKREAQRVDTAIKTARDMETLESQALERRLRFTGEAERADRVLTDRKIADARSAAEEQNRALDEQLRSMVQTPEIERWAQNERAKYAAQAGEKIKLALQDEAETRRTRAEEQARFDLDTANLRRHTAEAVTQVILDAERRGWEATRAASEGQVAEAEAALRQRKMDLAKFAHEGKFTAEQLAAAEVAAEQEAASKILGIRAQLAASARDQLGRGAGAEGSLLGNVEGAPRLLRGLQSAQEVRQQIAEVQQTLLAGVDAGAFGFADAREAAGRYVESLGKVVEQKMKDYGGMFSGEPLVVKAFESLSRDLSKGGLTRAASGAGPFDALTKGVAGVGAAFAGASTQAGTFAGVIDTVIAAVTRAAGQIGALESTLHTAGGAATAGAGAKGGGRPAGAVAPVSPSTGQRVPDATYITPGWQMGDTMPLVDSGGTLPTGDGEAF